MSDPRRHGPSGKPCDTPEYAALLPCCGPDAKCYGRSCWERKPLPPGGLQDIWDIALCPYLAQCREWWRTSRRTKK